MQHLVRCIQHFCDTLRCIIDVTLKCDILVCNKVVYIIDRNGDNSGMDFEKSFSSSFDSEGMCCIFIAPLELATARASHREIEDN
jgi:hypothetical protein